MRRGCTQLDCALSQVRRHVCENAGAGDGALSGASPTADLSGFYGPLESLALHAYPYVRAADCSCHKDWRGNRQANIQREQAIADAAFFSAGACGAGFTARIQKEPSTRTPAFLRAVSACGRWI